MNSKKARKNFQNPSPEDQIKLEEIDYRKALIRSHGFTYGEYMEMTKTTKKEMLKK